MHDHHFLALCLSIYSGAQHLPPPPPPPPLTITQILSQARLYYTHHTIPSHLNYPPSPPPSPYPYNETQPPSSPPPTLNIPPPHLISSIHSPSHPTPPPPPPPAQKRRGKTEVKSKKGKREKGENRRKRKGKYSTDRKGMARDLYAKSG